MAWYTFGLGKKKGGDKAKGSVRMVEETGDSEGLEYIGGNIIGGENGSFKTFQFDKLYQLKLKAGTRELPSVRITDHVVEKYSGDPKFMRLVEGRPGRLEVTERFLRTYIGQLAKLGHLRISSPRVEEDRSSTDVPIYNGEVIDVDKDVDESKIDLSTEAKVLDDIMDDLEAEDQEAGFSS